MALFIKSQGDSDIFHDTANIIYKGEDDNLEIYDIFEVYEYDDPR